MGKIAIGFFVGVLATGFAFALFGPGPESRFVSSDSDDATIVRGTDTFQAERVDSLQDGVLHAAATEAGGSVALTETLEARAQQVRQDILETWDTYTELMMELATISATMRRENEPIVSALPLPPEFDWLSKPNSFGEYDMIQREHVDPVWAADTESKLNAYFSERTAVIEKYGWPKTVHCRTTRCAVAFVSYGVDEASDRTIVNEFRGAISDFSDQPWAEQFITAEQPPGSMLIENADGVTSFYWTLVKRSRESNQGPAILDIISAIE